DQEGGRVSGERRLEEPRVARVAADGDWKCVDEGTGRDAAVSGDRDGGVPTETIEGGRQSTEHVCQPAGFRERLHLGADNQSRGTFPARGGLMRRRPAPGISATRPRCWRALLLRHVRRPSRTD